MNSDGGASTLINCPTGKAFTLEVIWMDSETSNNHFTMQRLTAWYEEGIYIRSYQSWDNIWTGWHQIPTTYANYPPSDHMHPYQCTACNFRFADDWIGFYPSAEDAINWTNRRGWMGYNKSCYLNFTNENGGIKFTSTNNFEFYDDSQVYFDFHNNNSGSDYTHRLLCQTGGNIIAYPGITNGSDRRWKKDEVIMDPIFLNVLKQLKTKTFRFIKADKNLRIGFIAQDVLEVMDNEGIDDQPIVQQNEEDGFYGIDYGQITSLLVAGWQEHEKTITELKTEISNLREEINDLKDIIEELKTMVKGDG